MPDSDLPKSPLTMSHVAENLSHSDTRRSGCATCTNGLAEKVDSDLVAQQGRPDDG